MLNCKQVVKIVSSEDRPTWRRRLEIRMHLLICHYCHRYVKHLALIKSGFKALISSQTRHEDELRIKAIEEQVLKDITEIK